MFRIKTQADIINQEEWDIILVFDACRFDYFEKYYKNVFGDNGKLQKAISMATWTMGWLEETFKGDFSNTILIWDELLVDRVRDISKQLKYGKKFDATKKFKKVVDVWTKGHDKFSGVIHPKETTEQTIKTLKQNPDCKIISKYFQVHDPYLMYTDIVSVSKNLRLISEGGIANSHKFSDLRKVLYHFISDETVWIVRQRLGFQPESWLAKLWLLYGRKGIIDGYVNDLELTMRYMKKISTIFPNKKIIITSDHGERLGEWGRYSHGGKRNKLIKEVPWYRIGENR